MRERFDELEARADEWMAKCGVKEMVANIAAVFASWASPEMLARFREQLEAIIHLSYVEGAARSRDTLPSPVEGDAREIAKTLIETSGGFRQLEERITAALLSAESRGRPQWQPIETAPKDGTRVNLCWKAEGGLSAHVELGKYSGSLGCWTNTYGKAFSGTPDFYQLLPAPPSSPEEG